MRETEFRQALRDEMSLVTRHRRLTETEVLNAARRASRRRQGAWASAGSVAAVVALAVGAVFTTSGDSRPGPAAGVIPTTQTDELEVQGALTFAKSGPHYDQSVTLLNLVLEIVPPGFEAPADVTAPAGNNLRVHHAILQGPAGRQWWEILASVPVTKAGGFGVVQAVVETPGNDRPPGQACDLLPVQIFGPNCQEVLVGDMRVGVHTGVPNQSGVANSFAIYRHEDGTVVAVEQMYDLFTDRPLAEMPLTPRQLAELAADPRWHVN